MGHLLLNLSKAGLGYILGDFLALGWLFHNNIYLVWLLRT
jgi:hypothetical protein